MNIKSKIQISALVFLTAVLFPCARPAAALESGSVQPLKDFRYPAFLYTPSGKNKTGDMMILLSEKKSPKDLAESWQAAAQKAGWYVLAIEVRLQNGEQPTFMDQWILNVKKEMAGQYGIKRFYFVGQDERAHYIAYFGLKHPNDFIAYGAIQGSWSGPFQKIVKPSQKAKKQAPFFIALDQADSSLSAAKSLAEEMTKKGYSIRFVVMNQVGEESSATLQNDLISWFKEQAVSREQMVRRSSGRTFKQKASQAFDDFFAV